MTTLADLVQDVMTVTSRPDLESKIELAIRSATLKAHQKDFFYKDLFETGIKFFTAEYQQELQYRNLIPNWRALKYVRKSDISYRQGEFLTIITPDSVVDDYSVNKEDVVYVAGLTLKLRCRQATQYFLVGCYVHPTVTKEGYSSWIADEYPLCIIYEAAAQVFKEIGLDERTKYYTDLAVKELDTMWRSNIVAHGS